ncbi:MAG: Uma2 family endonuclease [Planctomycetota bacterium]
MATDTRQSITAADELFAMPSDGNRYELVNGVLKMMSPAGSEHGDITARITFLLTRHVYDGDLGKVYAAETGFLISTSPDTVRAPDTCFVSHERLSTVHPTRGYLPLAPDLVIEVISPNDRFSEVEAKAKQWLNAGTKIVLVADPQNLSLKSYRKGSSIETFESGEIFAADEVCKDWTLEVDDAFEIK